MNFSFDLLGFDFLSDVSIYGVWIFSIKDSEDRHKSLFTLHYDSGYIRFELFFIRLH